MFEQSIGKLLYLHRHIKIPLDGARVELLPNNVFMGRFCSHSNDLLAGEQQILRFRKTSEYHRQI